MQATKLYDLIPRYLTGWANRSLSTTELITHLWALTNSGRPSLARNVSVGNRTSDDSDIYLAFVTWYRSITYAMVCAQSILNRGQKWVQKGATTISQ